MSNAQPKPSREQVKERLSHYIGQQVTNEDFVNPRDVLQRCLCVVTSMAPEQTEGTSADRFESMTYPAFYQGVFLDLELTGHLHLLLSSLGFEDFSVIDLRRPDSQRVLDIFVTFINFFEMVRDSDSYREQLALDADQRKGDLKVMQGKIDQARQTLDDINQRISKDAAAAEDMARQNHEAKRKNQELMSNLRELRASIESQVKRKAEYIELREQRLRARDTVCQELDENRKLLVTDPANLEAHIDLLKRRVVSTQEKLEALKGAAERETESVSLLVTTTTEVKDTLRKVEDCIATKNRVAAAQHQLNAKKYELQKLEQERLSLQDTVERLTSKAEKMRNMMGKHTELSKESRDEMERFRRETDEEIKQLQAATRANQRKAEESRLQHTEVKKQTAAIRAKAANEKKRYDTEYDMIVGAIERYMETITNAVDKNNMFQPPEQRAPPNDRLAAAQAAAAAAAAAVGEVIPATPSTRR
ncbi:kinetochore-associated Ndc80 complex subunit nuf2 [Blastocladiella emersonii ATCC 22665]|nr:kinetochore-associated Ndc80 complex subunit nuf2 [Blastocladiella emersonii ATCC 22665]